MTDEKLTPERAVRVLRAKGGELENRALQEAALQGGLRPVTELAADIGLIAQLLADYIESMEPVRNYAIADADHGVRGDLASTPPLVEARRDLLAKHHQQQRRNWPQQQQQQQWTDELDD